MWLNNAISKIHPHMKGSEKRCNVSFNRKYFLLVSGFVYCFTLQNLPPENT